MNKLNIFLLTILFAFILSCNHKDEVACTQEFRTIGITVTGDSLTDFYTIRLSTSDTLRFIYGNPFIENHWYPVLDDNYQSKIANSQESFRFVGEINDSMVVNETFIIKADACHIEKVSGRTEVSL
ncbi:MAG: hypothetical protein ACOYO1_09250 [Bacteroidales bacterium]